MVHPSFSQAPFHPSPFPIFVGRRASLIGVSQEGQNEEAMEQL